MSAETARERVLAVTVARGLWRALDKERSLLGQDLLQPVAFETLVDALVEPLGQCLRQVERDMIWQVLMYLAVELERRSRVGGPVGPVVAPEFTP